MATSIARQMARFALDLQYEDLPPAVIHEAKRFLYDTVGCAFGGCEFRDVHILGKLYRNMEGLPEATLLVSGERLPALHTALINAVAVQTSAFNDYYCYPHPSHPSTLIPAALALGEFVGATTQEVLLAIILGYEFELRLRELLHPEIDQGRIHVTTLAQWPTILMAGRLLQLPDEKIMHALGIAAIQRPTNIPTAHPLTMAHKLVEPLAVQWGIFAALLARDDYTGPGDITASGDGLPAMIDSKQATAVLTEDLGQDYRIMSCAMRAYPADLRLQTPVTAAIQLARDHNLQPGQVAQVRVALAEAPDDLLHLPLSPHGADRETVARSLPYCISRAVLDRKLDTRSFDDEHMDDPRLKALMPRVAAVHDKELVSTSLQHAPARVTILTNDGGEHTMRLDYPKGHPESPLTDGEIETKVNTLTASRVSADHQKRIRETVYDCDNLAGIHHFMALMVED